MTVPVRLANAVIRNESDWQNYIVFTDENQKIEGYFVLENDITLGNVKTTVKPAVVDKMSVGFCGVFDGNGKTITVPERANTGLGIFGLLGEGAKIANLTVTDDSGTSPGWISNTLLALVATNAEISDTIINLNGANHTSGARYGALTHEGIVNCAFNRVTINIDGKVQSLAGGGENSALGIAGTVFNSCIVNFLNDNSSLGEVGHIGNTIYVAKGASVADGEKTLDGIIIGGTKITDYLFENSCSEYSVVIPRGASATIEKAADEFIKYFAEGSGVKIEKVYDSVNLTHNAYQTYFSLGDTSLLKSADIGVADIKTNGYRLYAKDCNVYIIGGSDKGVLRGVYGLLNDVFGLEFYTEDCYEINVLSEALRIEYDLIFNPSVDLRAQTGIVLGTEEKFTSYSDHIQANDYIWAYLMPIINAADETKRDYGHNGFFYLPPALYKDTHPAFYSNKSTWKNNSYGGIDAQLCYTAHGNATEYALMVKLCAERIENSLIEYAANKTYNAVMLGMEDNYYTCTCQACTSAIANYGSISATAIKFLDDVATQVESWTEQSENSAYKRDLQYMFFAYNTFLKAPTVMPTVKNKIIPFVALSEMNYAVAANDTTERETKIGTISNADILNWMKLWGEFARGNGGAAWAWSYGNFYRDYFSFYNSYDFYKDYFKYLEEYGYGLSYVQQQSKQRNAYTAFYSLNQYVTSKLATDSSLDMDTLIDDYMNATYKAAAPSMKEYFNNWQTIFNQKMSAYSLGYDGKIGANFTYNDISRDLLDVLDKAYAAIEEYKTSDAELYATIKRRIDVEWLCPAKIALTGYESMRASQPTRFSAIRTKFLEIVEETGISAASEFKDIQTLIDEINSITV